MRSLGPALVVWALAATPVVSLERARAPASVPLSIPGYVQALDEVRSHLEALRLDEARTAAEDLLEKDVVWGSETLTPDPTLLEAVRRVATTAEARSQAARVRRLIQALQTGSGIAKVAPRPDVLAQVTPEPDIEKGGEAPRLQVKPLTFPEKVETALLAVVDWIAGALRTIGEWLRRLMPARPERPRSSPGTTATVAIAFAAVAAALLVVLAVRTLRRETSGSADAVSARVVSASRDEDPLSREANEWEAYARDLAAKRRWREAIRAWYHAVLVTLFRSGVLHHQRGRTNWEYVSRLSPDLTWRPGFVALTRRFDREWYGRRTSDGTALSECAREAREVLRAVRGTGETA